MDQLVERMLAVGAGLAPVDGAGLIVDSRAFERDALAVALHRELLQVGGETLEVLVVRQHGDRFGAEEIVYQTRDRPISTGRFFSNGAVRKCSSISWKPASISRKLSGPMASIVDRPIAESIE